MIRPLLLVFVVATAVTSDFYQTLGLQRSATDFQIRKAFKEKSLKLHPDRSPSPDARQQYQQIIQAYEVLKDGDKKRLYDLTGSTGDSTNSYRQNQYQQSQHQQNHNQFRGFQDIFRQFQQQINSRRQHTQKQTFQQNSFDEQEYQVRQYIDEFGRIHTVLHKRNSGPNFKSEGGLLEFAATSLMTPLRMVIVFGVAYLLVSICAAKEQRG